MLDDWRLGHKFVVEADGKMIGEVRMTLGGRWAARRASRLIGEFDRPADAAQAIRLLVSPASSPGGPQSRPGGVPDRMGSHSHN